MNVLWCKNSTEVSVHLPTFWQNNCMLTTWENIKSILKINVFSSSWSTEEGCHRRKNNHYYSKRGISTNSRYLIPAPWNHPVFLQALSLACFLQWACQFCVAYFDFLRILKSNIILQVPEIPKKKVPEEKRPVPQKEKEAPPPKGIVSLPLQEPSFWCYGPRQMMILLVLGYECIMDT